MKGSDASVPPSDGDKLHRDGAIIMKEEIQKTFLECAALGIPVCGWFVMQSTIVKTWQ